MTVVASTPGMFVPDLLMAGFAGGPYAFGAIATILDASGEMYAYIVQVPKTGNIRKLGFRTGTVTAATDTDVRLETVDSATGLPSGTLFGTNTNGTVASAGITANTWITATLTADAAVTRGQFVAVVVAPTGSPNYQIVSISGSTPTQHIPYAALKTSGSWGKSTLGPILGGLEYDDGTYAFTPHLYAVTALTDTTVSSGTTPDEIALKFKFAGPVRVNGAWLFIDPDGDFDIVLYDTDGTTPLATLSVDKDFNNTSSDKNYLMQFSASVSLLADTFYYLSFKPTSATTCGITVMTCPSAAAMDTMGGGKNMHYAQRTDAGAWAADTTKRPAMGLILDGLDDGTGSGGGGGSGNNIPSIGGA